jgi:hypothetical protein
MAKSSDLKKIDQEDVRRLKTRLQNLKENL